MSLEEYKVALTLDHEQLPINALLMAAMMRAASENPPLLQVLEGTFPDVSRELRRRPGLASHADMRGDHDG